jgi:TRAP-type C4-dicarboxylate transport system permease small subunit
LERFSSLIQKIEDGFILCGGILVIGLMILTIIDTTGRYFLNSPLKGNVEVSEILLVIVIALSIAGTQRVDGHVSMEFVLERLKRMQRPFFPIVKIVILFITEAIFLIALYYVFKSFVAALDMNTKTTGPLYIIFWPFQGILCLGVCLMCIRLLIDLMQTFQSLRAWGK